MPRMKRPLNPEAVKAADEALRQKTGGRPLTMSPEDQSLREEWAAAYEQAGGAVEPPESDADPVVGQTSAPCPADSKKKSQKGKPRSRKKGPKKACPPNDVCCGKGLRDPKLVKDYVDDFKKEIAEKWKDMKPKERVAAVRKLIKEQFKKAGVPPPKIKTSVSEAEEYGPKFPNNYGHATSSDWSLTLNGAIFNKKNPSDDELKELADTVLHEGRHIEQYYRTAQYRAANGDTADDMLTDDTSTHKPVDIPKRIAKSAAKKPLKKSDPKHKRCRQARNAKKWNDAKWGKGKLSQYRPGVDYMDRPLEKDAWAAGDQVKDAWDK